MANLKAIKKRIQSVNSTKHITKAMQMISASKMKKAERLAQQTSPYTQEIKSIVAKLGNVPNYQNPLLSSHPDGKIVVICIAPARGFVGSLVSNLISHMSEQISYRYKGISPDRFVTIGVNKLGTKALEKAGFIVNYHFDEFPETPTVENIAPLLRVVLDMFDRGEVKEVVIAYTHFINTLKQEPYSEVVLPISLDILSQQREELTVREEYLFEPSAHKILDFLMHEYIESVFVHSFLEANASEQSARMLAMNNATENAKELIRQLTLQYNKIRQASITQQLLEIAMGAEKI